MSRCEGLETAELLEIAPQCATCPNQAVFLQYYLDLGHVAYHLLEAGEELVGESGQEFDAFIAELTPSENMAKFLQQLVRKSASHDLDTIDAEKQRTQDESEGLTRSCDGAFKMRAAKGDVTYTVELCTSARAYVRDSEQPAEQLTNVWVKSREK